MSNVYEISDREIRDLSDENQKLKLYIEKLENEKDAIHNRLLKETKKFKVARDSASTIKHFKATG